MPEVAATHRPLIDCRARVRLSFLMVVVALAGVVFWAYRFRRENADSSQAFLWVQIGELSSFDAKDRVAAAEMLGNVGGDDAASALPRLIAAMRDPDASVRRASTKSLAQVVRGLPRRRMATIDAEMSSAVPPLVAALSDADATVRAEAAAGLAHLSDDFHFNDPKTFVRRIIRINPDPALAVPALERAASDPDAEVRRSAIRALGRIAPKEGDSPAILMGLLLGDPDPKIRSEAGQALVQPWNDAPRLWSPLVRRMVAKPKDEGAAAIGWSLNNLGLPPLDSLSMLLEAVQTDGSPARRSMPTALASFGIQASPALPRLLEIARVEMRQNGNFNAAQAIALIDPTSPEARAVLDIAAEQLHNNTGDADLWFPIIITFGPHASPLVPELTVLLERPVTSSSHCLAAQALGRIGPKAAAALPALARAATDGRTIRSPFAAKNMLLIDPQSPQAMTLATPYGFLMVDGGVLRKSAEFQLARIMPLLPETVTDLRKTASGPSSPEQRAAKRVLELHDVYVRDTAPEPKSP